MNKEQKKDVIEQLHTISDFIRWGSSRFTEAGLTCGHGTDNAEDEALFLVLHALFLKPGLAPELMGCRLTFGEREAVLELLLQRIVARVPAPYLTHKAWFAGLDFYVDSRVLVPRSPIGELIDAHFLPWFDAGRAESILDLCTGSGCIGIASALICPDVKVDVVDISEDALDVARINVERHDLTTQVSVVRSDLFSALDGRRYDLIVSNPPYVDAGEMDALAPEFKHEPSLGLAAGDDGLDIVVRILAEAADYLTEKGTLVVEVGNSDIALVDRFPGVPFVWPEFERGGHGVFILQASIVREYRSVFEREAAKSVG